MTVEEQPHRAAADSSSHAMAGIIVIEDDHLIRALLLEWLSAEGYLVLLRSHAEPLPDEDAALMIMDVFMPRHGGCAKLREVQAARPRTPLIAISGQFTAGSSGSSAARDLGVRLVLGKPFTRARLLCAVHDVLGEAHA
jgi:DNA-binding response OmpR family regulator